MNNIERNLLLSSIAANLGWLSAWMSDEQDIPHRAKVSESVHATLAFIESDGLSHTMWTKCRMANWGLPINEQAIKLVELRWEDICEMNAALSHHSIDFDIFDVSNEDAHNSLIRRKQAAGNPIFGMEYIHPTDASSEWLDDEMDHGSWGDAPSHLRQHFTDHLCRDGYCDGECHY